MKTSNPIGTLHMALAHATYIGLSDIHYDDRDREHYHKTKEDRPIRKVRRPSDHDLTVVAMFPQIWPSTALGFGGIGGAAMTSAYTIVVECREEHAVYFGGRHAYTIKRANARFFSDIRGGNVSEVLGATGRYETKA